MERVSIWPWYTDNSKDKETALQTSNLSILSACKEVNALSTRDTIKEELEKEACKIGFGNVSLGETPKVRSFKVVKIGWNFGSKIK